MGKGRKVMAPIVLLVIGLGVLMYTMRAPSLNSRRIYEAELDL